MGPSPFSPCRMSPPRFWTVSVKIYRVVPRPSGRIRRIVDLTDRGLGHLSLGRTLTFAPLKRVFRPVGRETQPPALCPVRKMPAKEPAVEDEGLGPQGGHVALQCLCGQAAAVHRMNPGRRKPLNATDNTENGVSATE